MITGVRRGWIDERIAMSEEKMLDLIQRALDARGIDDQLVAVGQFNPRGHVGGMFAGGTLAGEAGGLVGGVAEPAAEIAGTVAGSRAADAVSGLPGKMLVGISSTTVYGFDAASRRSEPTALVFRLPRAGLTANVHQRVNVRVLELIDQQSGARVQLEGNRLPITHSEDVIKALTGGKSPG
jgi:hypothetical protein